MGPGVQERPGNHKNAMVIHLGVLPQVVTLARKLGAESKLEHFSLVLTIDGEETRACMHVVK